MELTGWGAYGECVHTVKWYQIKLEHYYNRVFPHLLKQNPKVVKVYGEVVIYTLDNSSEELKCSRDLLKQEYYIIKSGG